MNVENKRDDRKKKIREIAGGILCIAVLLFIVMQIMLPETGIGGMVNEGSMAVLFFGVGAVCAYAAIKKRKEDKSALVLGLCLAVLACVPGGWISVFIRSFTESNVFWGMTAYKSPSIS